MKVTKTIKLSAEDIQQALADWAKSRGITPKAEKAAVSVECVRSSRGYGMAECEVWIPVATITVDEELSA